MNIGNYSISETEERDLTRDNALRKLYENVEENLDKEKALQENISLSRELAEEKTKVATGKMDLIEEMIRREEKVGL